MPHHVQANLAALIESTDDFIWSVDLDFRLLTFNRAFTQEMVRRYNITPAMGMRAEDTLPPEIAASWRSLYECTLREGSFRVEYPMADGRVLELSLSPIVVERKSTGISVFAKNITERKATERELFEAKQKLESEEQNHKLQLSLIHAIYEVSLDGMLAVNNDQVVMSCNQKFIDIWHVSSPGGSGITPENLVGTSDVPVLSNALDQVKDPDAFVKGIQALYKNPEENEHCEIELKDGRTLGRYSTSLRAEDGQYQGRIWFFRDITERKLAEAALLEAKQKAESEAKNRKLQLSLIRTIHEVSLDGILVVSPDGIILSINKRLFDVWRIPAPFSLDEQIDSTAGLPHEPILTSVLSLVKTPDAFLGWARELYADRNRNDQREIELKDGRTLEHYSTTLWTEEKQYLGRIWFIRDISERKQAEQALQRSEEMFRQLAENLHALVFILPAKADGTLYISPAYDAIWERNRDEVYQNMRLWMDAIHPEDREAAQARFARQKLGESTIGEYRILTPSNQVKWIRNHAFPVRDKDGELIRICGISEEITEQKRQEAEMVAANRALRASEQRFRDIFEQAAVGIVQTAFDGSFLACNARFAEIIGYPIDEITNQSMDTVTGPEDLASNKAVLQQMESGDCRPISLEKRYRRKDGSILWARATISPQRDDEGHVTNVISLIEDIDDRKKAESQLAETIQALKTSEERYRNVINLSPDAIFVGRKQAITIANKAAVELFGLSSASKMIGHRFSEFIREEDRNRLHDDLKRLYECETQIPLSEGKICRRDGSLVDVEISASSFHDGGEMVVQAVIRNTTERKQAEAENARLIRGIEQVNESITITDINGKILYVNPTFERVSGYSRAEAVGSNSRLLKSGRHPDSVYRTMWETLLRGETWSGDLINQRKDGTQYTESVTISPVKDPSGAIINFVSVNRDMTQELLLRNQLNQAQKMEATGRLAGGIAHDFNNLLMVIRTYAELLQDRLPVQDTLRSSTDQILKAVERGASLTGQMLAFSRKQIISPVELNLNAVIDETAKMLRRIIGEDIEFHVALYEPLWAIKADPDQMVQVLMNFCINARDAMPQGGSLTIETGNVTVEEGQIDEQHSILPGNYVRLSVTDSGIGMSKEVQKDIFEPFFTTKEVGKGSGLGLATIYGIVKQSCGHVWVESEPGRGACFTIYLPKIERATVLAIPTPVSAPPRGNETILVAEDEAPLRKGICNLLSNLGYTVLAAGSGEEALAIANEQNKIDLLLTDVVMPKMSGRELAQILGDLLPEMKIIYMSGYTDDAALRYGIHELRTAFLQKPFGLAALARKVRDTLGQTNAVQ